MGPPEENTTPPEENTTPPEGNTTPPEENTTPPEENTTSSHAVTTSSKVVNTSSHVFTKALFQDITSKGKSITFNVATLRKLGLRIDYNANTVNLGESKSPRTLTKTLLCIFWELSLVQRMSRVFILRRNGTAGKGHRERM